MSECSYITHRSAARTGTQPFQFLIQVLLALVDGHDARVQFLDRRRQHLHQQRAGTWAIMISVIDVHIWLFGGIFGKTLSDVFQASACFPYDTKDANHTAHGMPINVNADVQWTQTPQLLHVQLPLKGIPAKKVDVYRTRAFLTAYQFPGVSFTREILLEF